MVQHNLKGYSLSEPKSYLILKLKIPAYQTKVEII